MRANAQIIPVENNDSLLREMGLSTDLFLITTYQNAKSKHYDSKSYQYGLKNNDTIILPKVDTFFSKLEIINKIIRFKFDMSGVVFKDDIILGASVFKEHIYFYGNKFYKKLVFNGALFEGELFICRIKCLGNASFFETKFKSHVEFSDAEFNDEVTFYESKFLDGVLFVNVKFKNHTSFLIAEFYKLCEFKHNDFTYSPWFWFAQFHDTIDFRNTTFQDGVDFYSAKFNNYLSLHEVNSGGEISFLKANIPKFIDISSLSTKQTIDFNFINDSNGNKHYYINLYNTDIDNIDLNDRFSLWFDNNLYLEKQNSIYLNLLKKLDKIGFNRAYQKIDLDYKEFYLENYSKGFVDRTFYYLKKYWWNFGYEKENIFRNSFIFILIFTCFIYRKMDLFLIDVYVVETLKNRFIENKNIDSKFKRKLSDFYLAIIYTCFVFFNLRLSFDSLHFKRFFPASFILGSTE
jgi:uncharacterized protein YjbI with pentapeptide repeats